jgi:hypothetical protein
MICDRSSCVNSRKCAESYTKMLIPIFPLEKKNICDGLHWIVCWRNCCVRCVLYLFITALRCVWAIKYSLLLLRYKFVTKRWTMCILHNVQRRCRLWLSNDGQNLWIFDPQFCEGIPLSMKIMVCVSLTVSTFMSSQHITYIYVI